MKFKIRKAKITDVNAIAKVHIAVWKTTYTGIIPQDFLDKLSLERSENNWKKTLNNTDSNNVFLVCENELGEIVGFIGGGTNREKESLLEYSGELMAIYILKEYQKKGLGSLLMRSFQKELLKCGIVNMIIWVLKDNESRYFYEKLGGVLLKEKEYHIGGATQIGVSYGWKNIRGDIK